MTVVVNPASVRRTPAYSHAKVREGTPVFLTGQVAWDLDGRVVGIGDAAAQAAQAWSNLLAVLADLGLGVDDVVKLTTYIVDLADSPAIGAAKLAVFEGCEMPASTLLVVAGLAERELLVEIDAVAVIPPGAAPPSAAV